MHLCECCREVESFPVATHRYDLNEKILVREDKTKPFRPIYSCPLHVPAFERFAGTLTKLSSEG
jgi:hypothetical protein